MIEILGLEQFGSVMQIQQWLPSLAESRTSKPLGDNSQHAVPWSGHGLGPRNSNGAMPCSVSSRHESLLYQK